MSRQQPAVLCHPFFPLAPHPPSASPISSPSLIFSLDRTSGWNSCAYLGSTFVTSGSSTREDLPRQPAPAFGLPSQLVCSRIRPISTHFDLSAPRRVLATRLIHHFLEWNSPSRGLRLFVLLRRDLGSLVASLPADHARFLSQPASVRPSTKTKAQPRSQLTLATDFTSYPNRSCPTPGHSATVSRADA
jgi:hypothetical protein